MKRIFPVLFLLAFGIVLQAQPFAVEGRVVSDQDQSALQGASVFINNGSKGTSTDANGHFILSDISYTTFELVVSFVAYETIVIKIDPENIHKRFLVKMSPKVQELKEVVVGGIEKDGWKKWGPVFTRQFIGTSANARNCIVKNPQVLLFRRNKKTGVLTVSANDKLVIQNNSLGYTLYYQLEEFVYDQALQMVTYTGYPYFESIQTSRKRKDAKWEEERKAAYNGSVMHFMRSFNSNTIVEEGFEINYLIRLHKKDSATRKYYDNIMRKNYEGIDTSKFSIQFVKNSMFADPVIYICGKQRLATDSIRINDTANNRILMYFNNDLQVVYKNELESPEYVNQQVPFRTKRFPESSLIFLVHRNAVVVEKNGLYFEPLEVFTEGYWAYEKIAELLPSDYEVEK